MKTTKNTFQKILSALLASLVVLSCLHAKDIAGYQVTIAHVQASESRAGDIVAKVISDLHTHVDKASLKNIAKSVGDQAALAYDRHIRSYKERYGRSVAVALLEAMLLFRIALAVGR